VLHDHELWLQPSSMDGKVSSMGPGGRAALPTRVPKPNIVITSYEVVCSDVHALSAIQVRMWVGLSGVHVMGLSYHMLTCC